MTFTSRSVRFHARAALSDSDGVLVNSSRAIEASWSDFAERCELTDQQIADLMSRQSGRKPSEIIPDYVDTAVAHAAIGWYERREQRSQAGATAMPGAQRLLDEWPSDRLAVVTSASRPVAKLRFETAGLPVSRHMVTGDIVPEGLGKPHPYPFTSAVELLHVEHPDVCVEESIGLEDAVSGMQSLVAAGVGFRVGLATTTSAEVLAEAGADIIVPDLRSVDFIVTPSGVKVICEGLISDQSRFASAVDRDF